MICDVCDDPTVRWILDSGPIIHDVGPGLLEAEQTALCALCEASVQTGDYAKSVSAALLNKTELGFPESRKDSVKTAARMSLEAYRKEFLLGAELKELP